jgi:AcrR family transcriptional regulator
MSTSAPPKARAYHHGDLRQALIQAAQAVVERDGPEAVSLSALAKSLGVSQPAPYRHFADRDGLMAAVAAEGFRAFSQALRDSVQAPSDCSVAARMAQAYVRFGLERRGLYRLIFASPATVQAVDDSELRVASFEAFGLLLDAMGPASEGLARARRALKVWTGLHGVVMLADQGLLIGMIDGIGLDDMIADIVG